jgi:hypothetical protein
LKIATISATISLERRWQMYWWVWLFGFWFVWLIILLAFLTGSGSY